MHSLKVDIAEVPALFKDSKQTQYILVDQKGNPLHFDPARNLYSPSTISNLAIWDVQYSNNTFFWFASAPKPDIPFYIAELILSKTTNNHNENKVQTKKRK